MRKENGGFRPEGNPRGTLLGVLEMTGWDQKIDAKGRGSLSVRMTSAAGQRLPTCGLVLGEVTLLGEEGIGQYQRSNPASF